MLCQDMDNIFIPNALQLHSIVRVGLLVVSYQL